MHTNLLRPSPTIGAELHQWGQPGFPTVGFQVVGTISAGHYTPQATIDGQNWVDIPAISIDGTSLTEITVAGIYRCDVNGMQGWKLTASGDFSGAAVQVTSTASEEPLTVVLEGFSMTQIAPAWSAGTYAANDMVSHEGSFWIANESTTEEPGVASDWTEYDSIAEIITFILNQLA